MADPKAKAIGPWGRPVGQHDGRAERRLATAAALIGAALAALTIDAAGPPLWSWWQWTIVLAAAAELSGGMVAGALPGGKSASHARGIGEWRHLAFAAIQLHLPLMAMVAPLAMPTRAAWLGYVWLVGGAALMLAVPTRLRLAIGLALTAIGTVLMARTVPVDGLLGWMPVLLYLRIFVSYLVAPDPR